MSSPITRTKGNRAKGESAQKSYANECGRAEQGLPLVSLHAREEIFISGHKKQYQVLLRVLREFRAPKMHNTQSLAPQEGRHNECPPGLLGRKSIVVY